MCRFILVLLFFIPAGKLIAQPRFSTVCSAKTIGKDEFVNVEFMVENASSVERIIPPPFKNFVIVSGPNQQSGMSNINGTVKQYISLGYVLKPKAPGKYTIPAAYAKADGKDLHSAPVAIEVKKVSAIHRGGGTSVSPFSNPGYDYPQQQVTHEYDDYILKKGENPEEKVKRNLFIKVDVNKRSCCVGEPIIATYKLYTRLKSESSLTGTPSFNGFSVTDLGAPGDYPLTTEKYKGRDYSVYTLRKVQLYPLQSGQFELEPAEVDNRITFIKQEYAASLRSDIFYDVLRNFAESTAPAEALIEQRVNLKSEPVAITVKELPVSAPLNFKGAVGNFTINAAVEKSSFSTSDINNLQIVISGTGNLQMINAPHVRWPEGVDGFESKASENIDKMSVPMKGQKIFIYPFSISVPGKYVLPAVQFSYFDPSSSTYKSVTTKAFEVNVVKGQPPRMNAVETRAPNATFLQSLLTNRWIIIGVFALAAFALLWFIVLRKRQKPALAAVSEMPVQVPVAIEEVQEERMHPLADLEYKLTENDTAAFYSYLNSYLRDYLSYKLKIPVDELSRKRIGEKLDICNVGVGTTILLDSLLEEIELHLYAPSMANEQMQDVFEKATEVVSLLEKQC